MPTTVYLPIAIRGPGAAFGPGVGFLDEVGHSVIPNLDFWAWAGASDSSNGAAYLFGSVRIPHNLAATPNAVILLRMMAQENSNNYAVQIGEFRVPNGSSFNGTFTTETQQTGTVPATATNRFDLTFPSSGTLAVTPQPDDELMIEIIFGSTATLTEPLDVIEAVLRLDLA